MLYASFWPESASEPRIDPKDNGEAVLLFHSVSCLLTPPSAKMHAVTPLACPFYKFDRSILEPLGEDMGGHGDILSCSGDGLRNSA